MITIPSGRNLYKYNHKMRVIGSRSPYSTWQDSLLTLFGEGDDIAAMKMVDTSTSTTHLYVYNHLYKNIYLRNKIAGHNWTIGQNAYGSGDGFKDACTLYKAFNDITDEPVTQSGAGWTNNHNYGYVGGSLMYNGTAGRYLEKTFSHVTSLGIVSLGQAVYAGVFLVSIDSDNTLADLLPTAQDLVDDGDLSDTVLVANGGTLNPTDRIYDEYNLTKNDTATLVGNLFGDRFDLFTTSLTSGTHTLRLTVTGYKNVASSSTNCFAYYLLGTGSETRIAESGDNHLERLYLLDDGGANWISYAFTPTGASGSAWLGHEGMTKIKTDHKVIIDNVEISFTNWRPVECDEVIYRQNDSIRHPDIDGGATEVGVLDVDFTFNRTSQQTISHTVTWLTNGTVYGYPCMLAVQHAVFDRYKTYTNSEIDLLDGDNSNKLNTDTNICWCWDYDGEVAALMYIPDLLATCDNWIYSSSYQLNWMDITNSAGWKKAYTYRYNPARAYSTDDEITGEANYRIAWFHGGANSSLAGKY